MGEDTVERVDKAGLYHDSFSQESARMHALPDKACSEVSQGSPLTVTMTTVTERQARRKGESRTTPSPGTCMAGTSLLFPPARSSPAPIDAWPLEPVGTRGLDWSPWWQRGHTASTPGVESACTGTFPQSLHGSEPSGHVLPGRALSGL